MPLVIKILSGPFGDPTRSDASVLLSWIRRGQTLTVGRTGEQVDMAVRTDARMSGTHFQLVHDDTGCRIRDLNSRNGTILNGEKITDALLRDGDVIRAGQTTFGVSILADESDAIGTSVHLSSAAQSRKLRPPWNPCRSCCALIEVPSATWKR
jgi:pSer/pThr/pTyr-binding forkhead associated (FHA) protein